VDAYGNVSDSGSLLSALGLDTSDSTAATTSTAAGTSNAVALQSSSSTGDLYEALGLGAVHGRSLTDALTMRDLGYTGDGGSLRIDVGNGVTASYTFSGDSTVQDVLDNLNNSLSGYTASLDSASGKIVLTDSSAQAVNYTLQYFGVDPDAELDSALAATTKSIVGSATNDLFSALGITPTGATATDSLRDLGYSGENGMLRFTIAGTTTTINVNGDKSVQDVINKLNADLTEQGKNYTAYFDSDKGIVLKDENGASVNFDVQAFRANEKEDDSTVNASYYDERKAVKIEGSDATIVLNGAVFTGSSNYFNINGFGITVSGVTTDLTDEDGKLDMSKLDTLKDSDAVTLSTSVDADSIYDTIKDFLTNYNNIINEMTKLYSADSAKDYEPLTDDEKSAMTDTEISKWETKIKDSLLRRDTTLGTLMSAMKNSMSQTISVNGKKYALSSFGICTLSYGTAPTNEESAYHIDGDEDDENTSGNTDKLLAAINENPDTVVSFMKQLATNLYNAIDSRMTSTTLRSRYCIYNDKELQDQYDNYTTIISEWEDKVADKEDYYYEKFASMETALSNLNSQTSALSGLLGS
jgi:flagellar hook-associated protein 2